MTNFFIHILSIFAGKLPIASLRYVRGDTKSFKNVLSFNEAYTLLVENTGAIGAVFALISSILDDPFGVCIQAEPDS